MQNENKSCQAAIQFYYFNVLHYMFYVHIIYYTYHETDIDDDMKVYVFQILFTLRLDIQIIPLSFLLMMPFWKLMQD